MLNREIISDSFAQLSIAIGVLSSLYRKRTSFITWSDIFEIDLKVLR
jgi:hypothetical protein